MLLKDHIHGLLILVGAFCGWSKIGLLFCFENASEFASQTFDN